MVSAVVADHVDVQVSAVIGRRRVFFEVDVHPDDRRFAIGTNGETVRAMSRTITTATMRVWNLPAHITVYDDRDDKETT